MVLGAPGRYSFAGVLFPAKLSHAFTGDTPQKDRAEFRRALQRPPPRRRARAPAGAKLAKCGSNRHPKWNPSGDLGQNLRSHTHLAVAQNQRARLTRALVVASIYHGIIFVHLFEPQTCVVDKIAGDAEVRRCPLSPFWGRIPLVKYTEKGCPYSNLSTGGPRLWFVLVGTPSK